MRTFSMLVVLVAAALAHAAEPDWKEILGPSQGAIPAPRPETGKAVEMPTLRKITAITRVTWEGDMNYALQQARVENRPVFVTFRCLPCKACSDFDKTVLEGGPDLDPLYRQFITVRLTSAKDVPLDLLPMNAYQDMDVSWWGWFLSPAGEVYGVFGGRDETGDTARTTKAAMIATMNRVLAHHYDPRRPGWGLSYDAKRPAPATRPTELPGFESWLKHGENKKQFEAQGCLHCHQVSEVLRQPAIDAGTLDKHHDLDVWPLPENVGVVLDRDHGLLVKEVVAGSPAEAAGIKPGDVLGAAEGRRLFSQADFRGVLHRGPSGAGEITVHYVRGDQVNAATLKLAEGWRKTQLYWRSSIVEGAIGASLGFWPVDAAKHRQRLGIAADTMAVEAFAPRGPAAAAGLKKGDVITAVNGESPNVANRKFLYWFKMKFNPGDEVTLTVREGEGKERKVTYKP